MRRGIFFVLLCCSLDLLISGDTEARYYRRGGGYGGYGAQTPFSAAQHGMADLIRSQGMYNQATAQAMVNFEKARSSYIANEQAWMQAYQTRKRARQMQRAAESDEAHAKLQRYQQYLAEHHSDAPKLSDNQLNPTSGQITWPRALQEASFAEHRNSTEAFFSQRAQHSPSATDSKKVRDTIHQMRDELRNHIHELNTNDYLDARKFLIGLDTEIDHIHG